MRKYIWFLCVLSCLFISCGGNNKSTSLNQQRARILVVPSDQLLERFGSLEHYDNNGRDVVLRDYFGYFTKDTDSKFIISVIQSGFVEYGYPLNDLEQTLKSLNDRDILDGVDNIRKDAKTILLSSAHPDIIIEADYNAKKNYASRSVNKTLSYTLRAIDAVNNKVISSVQQTGVQDPQKASNESVAGLLKSSLQQDMPSFTEQIDKYFKDLLCNGREITVRVVIDGSSSLTMKDELTNGDVISDYILDYVKVYALNGAYNLSMNTDSEMYFTNVRIQTQNDDGTQFSAYDFARDMAKNFRTELDVKCTNETQGLSDACIIIR